MNRRRFIQKSSNYLFTHPVLIKLSEKLSSSYNNELDKIEGKSNDGLLFDSTATTYNPYNAYSLAIISWIVYKFNTKEDVESQARKWNFNNIYFYKKNYLIGKYEYNSSGIILSDTHKIVIAFSGYEREIERGIANSAVRGIPISQLDGKVNIFAYNAFNSIWEETDIQDQIQKELQRKKRPLWFTGYSLGGAIALLASASWQFSKGDINGLYTYGQPKVGDKDFQASFDSVLKSKSFVIVNNHDIVSRIPYVGYEHIGSLIYLDKNGDLYERESLSILREIVSKINSRRRIKSSGLVDHDLFKSYLPKLKSQIDINQFQN